jgi:cytochrome c-type biogenesis protein CcmF
LAGYEFHLAEMQAAKGPNYNIRQGHVRVSRNGNMIVAMKPEQRFYPVRQQNTTEAAIHTTVWGDLYITLGEVRDDGVVLRLAFRSLIPWLWMGALLMMLGGILSLSDRRLRMAVPVKSGNTPKQTGVTVS